MKSDLFISVPYCEFRMVPVSFCLELVRRIVLGGLWGKLLESLKPRQCIYIYMV